MNLTAAVNDALAEMELFGTNAFNCSSFKTLLDIFEKRKSDASAVYIRKSGFMDAMRRAGSPMVPPMEIGRRARRFYFILQRMWPEQNHGHQVFTEPNRRFLLEALSAWAAMCRARLRTSA
jgi:hypothetical protein